MAAISFQRCGTCGKYQVSEAEMASMSQGRDFVLDDFCPFVKGNEHPAKLKNAFKNEG